MASRKNTDVADTALTTRTENFERSSSLDFMLPPRATTVLTLKLKTPGTPYWSRPDLGISSEDITRTATGLRVTVHSLGSVPAPATTLALRNAAGKILATAPVPALAAPNDLLPKTAEVTLTFPVGTSLEGTTVTIDPDGTLGEITTLNNTVRL